MDRRTFIAGLAAAAAAPQAAFAAPGISASPSLIEAFRSVTGIHEGSGGGTLHILFAPWCYVSPQLYRETRAFTGMLSLRWIPFSGGQPEGSEATERLLRSPHAASVAAAFTTLKPLAARMPTPLADAQDLAVETGIVPQIIRDSGRGAVTPTVAYSFGGGRVRLLLGGPGPGDLAQIARIAE